MIKAAAYCRVSTEKEDQANSFESQQRFFREYIRRKPGWELYEIYADEGITGTSTKKRVRFNRMIDDAFDGKFDLILTKEVSRFSRNILDTIRYTRELKALGVGVIFMTDGINTLDTDAEMKLSLMASMAQDESRRTSARVKWGQTRQMERGVVFGRSLLGYDVKEGKLTINPEGAELVRLIFQKYGIEKKGTTVIARELREAGFATSSGNVNWSNSHIVKILKNEKYVGDLVQKKTYTPDYLTHSRKRNRGEEELVCIRNHHEPIVSRELWDAVQRELETRNRHGAAGHSNRYVFSGKIKCAECGSGFVSRVRRRKDGSCYRRWGCRKAALEGSKGCGVGKLLREELAMDILKQAIRSIPMEYNQMIQSIPDIVSESTPTPRSVESLQKEIDRVEGKRLRLMDAYLAGDITRAEMLALREKYRDKLQALKEQLDAQQKVPNENEVLRCKIEAILRCETDHDAFYKGLLDQLIVHKDGRIEVRLNGLPQVWVFELVKE